MEEKKETKISLSTFLLIIALIAIIVMGLFIYKLINDKNTEINKSAELQSQVDNLNGTVSNLQGKIDKVSETLKQDSENNTTNKNESIQKNESNTTNNDASISKKTISGRFAQNSPEDKGSHWFDEGEYWFKNDGTVENVASATATGTYTISGNTIHIHWTEFEGQPIKESERKDSEFLIKDENTLLSLTYDTKDNSSISNVSGTVFYRQNNN